MSSEAAQKAYPESPEFIFRPVLMQAFDRGAVEALRQAESRMREWLPWNFDSVEDALSAVSSELRRMADEREAER